MTLVIDTVELQIAIDVEITVQKRSFCASIRHRLSSANSRHDALVMRLLSVTAARPGLQLPGCRNHRCLDHSNVVDTYAAMFAISSSVNLTAHVIIMAEFGPTFCLARYFISRLAM